MKCTAGLTLLNHRRNDGILGELNMDPTEKKLAQYEQKFLDQVRRIISIRYLKQLLEYWPTGWQRPEWPLKRLLRQLQSSCKNISFLGLCSLSAAAPTYM